MPEKEGRGSMFETVQNHENRIVILENRDQAQEERLKRLEDQSVKLENTILTENRDTRSTMKEQTEKLFTIVENAMGYQNNRTAQDHELKMLKLNTWSTVFLKFAGAIGALGSAGGLIYLVAQHFLTK